MATCERRSESDGPDDDNPVHDRTESPPGDGFVGEVLAVEGDRVIGLTQPSTCPGHDRFASQPGGRPTDDLGKSALSEFMERHFLGSPAILHVDDVAVARVDPLVRDKAARARNLQVVSGVERVWWDSEARVHDRLLFWTMEQYWAAEGAEE